jgi:hypothetical protein
VLLLGDSDGVVAEGTRILPFAKLEKGAGFRRQRHGGAASQRLSMQAFSCIRGMMRGAISCTPSFRVAGLFCRMSSALARADGQGTFSFAHDDGLLRVLLLVNHVRGGSIRLRKFVCALEVCLYCLSEPDAGILYAIHLFAPSGDGVVVK